jgi:hypothetical protein
VNHSLLGSIKGTSRGSPSGVFCRYILSLDSFACFIKEEVAPESNNTLTRGGFEFDSNFKYAKTVGTRLEVDNLGLERLQIEGNIKHS